MLNRCMDIILVQMKQNEPNKLDQMEQMRVLFLIPQSLTSSLFYFNNDLLIDQDYKYSK